MMELASFSFNGISEEEKNEIIDSKISMNTPLYYASVSNTQLSLAMHCGAITVNNSTYLYIKETDELIRDDVLHFISKLRKQKAKEDKISVDKINMELF